MPIEEEDTEWSARARAARRVWQPIEGCLMTPGSEVVVKLRRTATTREAGFWYAKSVHQIGRWDAEGVLWGDGNREIPRDLIEGYIFIPD